MSVYGEYLNRHMHFKDLEVERKKQLKLISELRGGRDIIVYASDLTKGKREVMMDYSDILPFGDLVRSLKGTEIDVIVETPGGFAEVAESLVKILRLKYQKVGMIIPGWAKSAGTIFVMAGDEILMGPSSALGPIDGQISFRSTGKSYSAHAFLEGLQKMKEETLKTGRLNPVHFPILQAISPGEIQGAENAQALSRSLVSKWLSEYKFKYWDTHATSGTPVTVDQKRERANEIGEILSNQSLWLTHNRSLGINELQTQAKLQINDYSTQPQLDEAIRRYYTLLRMGFETTCYKVYETIDNQIYRFFGAPQQQPLSEADVAAFLEVACQKCQTKMEIQANFVPNQPLKSGALPYPIKDDILKCVGCGIDMNLSTFRLQIEGTTGKKLV